MSYYVELSEAYLVTQTVNGITAVRQFHDDGPSSATLTLPVMGERLSSDQDSRYYSVFVVERQERKFGGHPSKVLWTISYSSDPLKNPNQSGNVLLSKLPTEASVGGELISISKDTAGYTWKSGAAIGQSIPKRIGTGSFKITKRVANLELLEYAKKAGLVNSSDVVVAGATFTPTTVLFEGAHAVEYWNDAGNRRWRVEFNFVTKYIAEANLASNHTIAIGGWLFLLNETTGKFEETTPVLYNTGDLSSLLATPEAP